MICVIINCSDEVFPENIFFQKRTKNKEMKGGNFRVIKSIMTDLSPFNMDQF